MDAIVFILLFVVIVATIVAVLSGVKIVQPYEQAVYMRLGKYIRVLNQGMNFVCPLINQAGGSSFVHSSGDTESKRYPAFCSPQTAWNHIRSGWP